MSAIYRQLSSIFHYIVDRNSEPKRLLVLGLDAAGKTTFLYKLRSFEPRFLGQPEVITTIPTIGFNVETITTNKHSMKCWDIGGCDKIRPLWRHYMQNIGGIVLFLDSNDRDRVPEAKNEMDMFLKEDELAGVPLLVVGNKADLPNCMQIAEIAERLQLNAIRGHDWHIISSCMITGDGLVEIMDWVNTCSVRSGVGTAGDAQVPSTTGTSDTAPSAAPMTGNLIAETKMIAEAKAETDRQQQVMAAREWVERLDIPESEFLGLLESYQLDVWDHYTHVRIAWALINKHGIEDGFNKVAQAIQGYITHSARTDGKSFHATMTRFWCHMIAYCMHLASWRVQDAAVLTFKKFIAIVCQENSHVGSIALWDKTLFKQYYSSAVMFGAKARAEVVSPNVQALPDIVPVLNSALVGGATAATDTVFLEGDGYWRLGAL